MIKSHYIITLICLLVSSRSELLIAQIDSTTYHQAAAILSDSKQILAPDKRTKIIEIAQFDPTNNFIEIRTTEMAAVPTLKEKLKNVATQIRFKILPEEELGENLIGIVNLSVANLRVRPQHSAEMATQVLLGTKVDILQKQGGDFRVRTPEGYIAWIPTSAIVNMSEKSYNRWKELPKLMYTEEFGRSYSQPSSESQRISDLVHGDILTLMATEKEYYKVQYPDLRVAYILKKEALSFDKWLASREANAENIIASAKTMLGLPYLWGGTSVKAVDCSGLTKTAFYMNGVVIPRDASQQVLAGEEVQITDESGAFNAAIALAHLKPADLLFFAAGKDKTPHARVTHVALYIGNGEFIHAAGTVRINSVLPESANYDDFQSRTIVAARRYIGSQDAQIQKIKDNAYYK